MNDTEKFKADCQNLKSSLELAEYVKELENALSDIVDGNTANDLVCWTGMMPERAEDIMKIGAKIFHNKWNMKQEY